MKFNYIQHYNSTEFNYPFEELRHELGIFQAKCVTSTTFNWLKNTIDSFKYKLCYNFNLSESEIGEFEIIYSLNEVATVRCRNIFTACILYDHYIPNFLLKCADSSNEVIFTNGDRIYYDYNINEFMMELGNDIDNIDLSNNFIIKPEVELPPIKGPIEIIRNNSDEIKIKTDICYDEFSLDELYKMVRTATYLCKNIQGAKLAFVQSDEISILLTDFETITTDA